MDLMGQFQDLLSVFTVLATQPLKMFKESCIFGIRTFYIVVLTWMEVLRSSVNLHRTLICRSAVWFYAIISFPVRVLTALQREKQMQMHLYDMQMALDHFASNDKQLRQHLNRLSRKCRAMEQIIEEFDDEYDKAISNIQILQHQLQNAKNKEIQDTKASSDNKHIQIEDVEKHEDDNLANQNMKWEAEICQMREGALRQTIFGALMCPLVGMIIWESEDPCMPLVVALYAVVGMSLSSVIQLFLTVDKMKPAALASDAVAMLSFNCFILGTLTYPTLPRIAPYLTPLAMKLLETTGLA
ncbi:uncharacterized protein LOC124928857 [Impatiens glandulifera]|uniref:uncharacterized protein LOC124928857 n=1 Tax=Impatiens glandulifera TaxID=253017 RepID=UPI001FB0CD39|nr:uncharacterized protein LOC124928857 [Impatiens glandulifera]